jgi:hypothetical protein
MKTVGIWGGQHGAPKKTLLALFKMVVVHFPEKTTAEAMRHDSVWLVSLKPLNGGSGLS